jgi:hypothetical protein
MNPILIHATPIIINLILNQGLNPYSANEFFLAGNILIEKQAEKWSKSNVNQIRMFSCNKSVFNMTRNKQVSAQHENLSYSIQTHTHRHTYTHTHLIASKQVFWLSPNLDWKEKNKKIKMFHV